MSKEFHPEELRTLTCGYCAQQCASSAGLKIHKTSADHWGKESDEVLESLKTAPDRVATKKPKQKEKANPKKAPKPKEKPVEDIKEMVQPPVNTPSVVIDDSPDVYVSPIKMGITEIPIGATLLLSGSVYYIPKNQTTYETIEIAPGTPAKVVRTAQNLDMVWLYCQVVGSSLEAIVSQDLVIPKDGSDPIIKISKLGKEVSPVPTQSSTNNALEPVQSTVEDPVKLEKYRQALLSYAQARDLKNSTQNKYDEVDKETRPIILEYVIEVGVESEEGKGDHVLKESGYKTHYTFTPGAKTVVKDESKAMKYLEESQYLHCIKTVQTVDWEKWEILKKNGGIPAEVIQEVEVEKVGKDVRKLLVTKLDENLTDSDK